MVRRLLLVCVIGLVNPAGAAAQSGHLLSASDAHFPKALQSSVSPPVRDLPPQAHTGPTKEMPIGRPLAGRAGSASADPIVQTYTSIPGTAQALGQWEGLGGGYPGYSVTAVPPDSNLAVGPNHIVQWVNNAFVVFDKQGRQLLAPVADSTFWANASCNQLGGFSDPIVQYDRVADRWIIGEVGIPLLPGLIGQFAQCFAVSQTSDPTGAYYMWGYGFGSNLNDYPKISVWPDGYYVTWNIFSNAQTFVGPEACAWDRNAMLAGVAAPSYVCFKLGTQYASLLPSDLDGSRAPPTGSPNFVLNIDPSASALYLWKFHVDYAQPQNSTFTGAPVSNVAPFTAPCLTTQDCIPQPATTQMLDALGDRLMYRVAYRNFGDHASLVANHSVVAGGSIGVRWYEIRDPGGSPTIFQQSTFAPDSDNRWMASVAMDQSGSIGVGYSVASAATYPSIRFSGWEVGNPLGTLQNETFAVAGGGAQTGYNRWGDYSAMRVDPVDDCTFWYSQEYQAVTASANWNTRIVSFRFQSCGGSSPAPTTTTVGSSLNPSTLGDSVTLVATVSPSAASGSVEFFDGATSLGAIALSGGSASLTTSTLSAGSHAISAVYSGDSTHATSTSATLTQVVNGPLVSTTASLTSSPNPSTFGQGVSLVTTVIPSSGTTAPTGTVTFSEGATVLGTGSLDSHGLATFVTSSLAVGTHTISARYAGDSTYSGSSSNTVSQTVTKATTTTTVTSNRNPANGGQPITFTATVSPSAATGTVEFFDGAVSLGTAALTNGTATLTANLSSGTHSITARYGGNANYNGSTSAVLTETVNRKK